MKTWTALRLHLAVILFYAVVALIVTFPLVLHAATQFPGFVYGDAHEMAHHIWWFGYALRHGEPLFYQSLLAYPVGIDGVTLWANPLQFFPASALALAMPLALALNVQIWLTMALNGWAMWLLARYLIAQLETDARVGVQHAAPLQNMSLNLPPLLAGWVFMLFPTMQGHLGAGHAGLMVQWGVPLYVYGLFRLSEQNAPPLRKRIGLIGLTALAFVIGAAGHSLQVIYVLLPLTGLFALALIARRNWRGLLVTVIAAGIGALALGLFLIPAIRATLGTAAYTDEGGAVRYSADVLAAVTPSFFHPLFGRLDYTHQVLGINLDEGAGYIGLVAALLGVIAVVRVKAARWWLLIAAVAVVLSLGPLLKWMDQPVSFQFEGYRSYVTLPFALIADLPFIRLARTPGRFNFLTALAVAVLAGYGAAALSAWLWDRLRRMPQLIRVVGLVGLMALIGFEYQMFFPLPTTPAEIPQAVIDLGAREDVRAVLDLPWENLVTAKDGLYLQTGHQHALIAGQVSRRTPVDPALLTLLETTLDPALLDRMGADVIIVHREQDDGTLESRARERLGDPFYEDAEYALFNRPSVEGSPAFQFIAAAQTADESTVYVYAPNSGWVDAQITLATPSRAAELRVDGRQMFIWDANSTADTTLQVWLPSSSAESAGGFHTIQLASVDRCPQVIDPSLTCPPIGAITLDRGFRAQDSAPAVALDHGIGLLSARVDTLIGRAVHVYLTWTFDQPITANDVRYVHVIDAAGNPILQDDHPLGLHAAGGGWQDQVYLYRSGFAPGEYRVYVGWYHLSDDGTLTNYPILGGAPDGSTSQDILIGTFTVE